MLINKTSYSETLVNVDRRFAVRLHWVTPGRIRHHTPLINTSIDPTIAVR
jgi:hypothetical protein